MYVVKLSGTLSCVSNARSSVLVRSFLLPPREPFASHNCAARLSTFSSIAAVFLTLVRSLCCLTGNIPSFSAGRNASHTAETSYGERQEEVTVL